MFAFTLFSVQIFVWSSLCPMFLVMYAKYVDFSCSARIIWVSLHSRIILGRQLRKMSGDEVIVVEAAGAPPR